MGIYSAATVADLSTIVVMENRLLPMMPETRTTLRYAAIIAVVFGIIWMVSF